MRVATSTNLFGHNRERTRYCSTFESIERCRLAGFRVLDMNFCPMNQGRLTEFCNADFIQQAYDIREFAEKNGVVFSQSHLPFFRGYMPGNTPESPNEEEWLMECTRRAILAGEILGVKWAVVHPYTNIRFEYDSKENLKYNLEYYEPIAELLKKHGQGMAIENMFTLPEDKILRRYCDVVEEQIELIDAFHDTSVGACWDFGHAHLMYRDQTVPLNKLGGRLKATHVDDNKRKSDSHLLPFTGGSIKWESVMSTLTKMGYEGDFTYEIQGYMNLLPEEFWDKAAKFAYQIGEHCLKLSKPKSNSF